MDQTSEQILWFLLKKKGNGMTEGARLRLK